MLNDQWLTAIVVARTGSTRVKDKMHRLVGGVPMVLRKVQQLLKTRHVDRVLVGTDDKEMPAALKDLGGGDRVLHLLREPCYCDEISRTPNDMVRNMAQVVDSGYILWAHPTNPLCDETEYGKALDLFMTHSGDCDSLFSATRMQSHFWYKGKPLNHEPHAAVHQVAAKTEPVYFQNGAIFIRRQSDMRADGRFVGGCPVMYPMSMVAGWDVDEEWQLRVAQMLAEGTKP